MRCRLRLLGSAVVRTAAQCGVDPLASAGRFARHEGSVYALSNRCVHRGGALDEGELSGGCVVCPLHGSTFRLSDGAVERGPAAYPQPAWEVRVRDGVIELKR